MLIIEVEHLTKNKYPSFITGDILEAKRRFIIIDVNGSGFSTKIRIRNIRRIRILKKHLKKVKSN